MRYGFVLPFGDARAAAELAALAEQSGWDGFFVWEPIWGWDAWVSLTAAAMRTEHIRLGTMLTPLSRMRPWKLASESVNLDHLSGGRLILAVGLGAPETGFANFGEVSDRRVRAELLDEGLALLTGLWSGAPLRFQGRHYQVDTHDLIMPPPPPPLQQPRIPIWVVGAWPSERSLARVLRYDGLIPSIRGEDGRMRQTRPEELRAVVAYLQERRAADQALEVTVQTSPGSVGVSPTKIPCAAQKPGVAQETYPKREQLALEIIVEGQSVDASTLEPWAAAGATWWLETLWDAPLSAEGMALVHRRVAAGPPR